MIQMRSTRRMTPAVASRGVEVMRLAEAMGLAPNAGGRLGYSQLAEVADQIAEQGIGATSAATLTGDGHLSMTEIRKALDGLLAAMRESPLPRSELRSLGEILGRERIAALVGTSEPSLRRYLAGSRRVPDDIAQRAHALAIVVSYLRGAYNALGVRRWFKRPRTQLDGKAPQDLLLGDWDPADPGPARVAALARALAGSPAT
jgi:uncharacterized protein (DUF2384 family)